MWTRSLPLFLALLFSLLVLLPLHSEVCLTDEEWTKLEMIWTELEELLEKQDEELELAETQLSTAEQAIERLGLSLEEVKNSLSKQEKEHRRKTVVWAMGSFLVGSVFGLVAGVVLE